MVAFVNNSNGGLADIFANTYRQNEGLQQAQQEAKGLSHFPQPTKQPSAAEKSHSVPNLRLVAKQATPPEFTPTLLKGKVNNGFQAMQLLAGIRSSAAANAADLMVAQAGAIPYELPSLI